MVVVVSAVAVIMVMVMIVLMIMLVIMIVLVLDGICLGLRFASHACSSVALVAAAQAGSGRTEEHRLQPAHAL